MSNEPAQQAAATALADAILDEYNNAASKLKGFSGPVIEKIEAYQKLILKAKAKEKAKEKI